MCVNAPQPQQEMKMNVVTPMEDEKEKKVIKVKAKNITKNPDEKEKKINISHIQQKEWYETLLVVANQKDRLANL